jgi:hypothetical protein
VGGPKQHGAAVEWRVRHHRAVDSKGLRPQPEICVHHHRDGHLFELQTTGAAHLTGVLLTYRCVSPAAYVKSCDPGTGCTPPGFPAAR